MQQHMETARAARAKYIISRVVYVTLATVSKDGTPWNTPVFSAYDANYHLYWGSYVNSQHSQNIKDNGKVFLVIYDSTIPAGQGEGVYIEATAAELQDSQEIAHAHQLLQARRPVPYWPLEQVQGNGPARLYKAIPKHV